MTHPHKQPRHDKDCRSRQDDPEEFSPPYPCDCGLAEREKDRERLDWYFNQKRFKIGPCGDGYGAWDMEGGRYPILLFHEPFKDVREALDAARRVRRVRRGGKVDG